MTRADFRAEPAPSPAPNEPLAIVKLTFRKAIHLRLEQFQGSPMLDIRRFWLDDGGCWMPGRQGVTIPATEKGIRELIAALETVLKGKAIR